MSALVIFTETGFPHCGCVLDFDRDPQRWLGWQPDTSGRFSGRDLSEWTGGRVDPDTLDGVAGFMNYWGKLCEGFIDRRVRTDKINYYVRFTVEGDEVLHAAERKAIRDYVVKNDVYAFGNRDCVTFARDVAKYCGLETGMTAGVPDPDFYSPTPPSSELMDLLPYELLRKLYRLNPDRVDSHNWDAPGELPG